MPGGTWIEKPTRPRRRKSERYADNQQLALPKPGVRIRDERVLNWARRRGVCEVCLRTAKTDPAHIKSVGSGGHDTFDNVTALCRQCHDLHHASPQRVTDEQLRQITRHRQPRPSVG
jgi:5-methylcytosine-specific restriction endonuclease McrA